MIVQLTTDFRPTLLYLADRTGSRLLRRLDGKNGRQGSEILKVRGSALAPHISMDPNAGISGAGRRQNGQEGTLPMFEVKKVDMEFSIASDFVAAQVANNVLILALQTGRIMRIDLDNPEEIDGTHSL